MLRSKWMRHFAVLTLIAMLAAACGDGAGEETPEPTETDTAEVTEPTETEEPTEVETDEATEPAPEDTEVEYAGGDGTLTIGTVLPETGDLAFLGPPMIAGAEMAVQDLNEAGGVLDGDVNLLLGDEGGDGAIANQTVDRHIAAAADAILGAAASGISLTFIDKVTGAGLLQFSPSNTATTFTDYEDNGFYFRTAPSDALQGPVLADTIIADGHSAVAILARSDDYGRGLADATAEALEEAGAEVLVNTVYDQNAQNFDADVQQVAAENPDAVVVVGFDETSRILQSMIEQGIGPDAIGVYGVDGNRADDLAENVDPENPGVIAGMRGTSPAAASNEEFTQRLQEFRPELQDTLFAPESYDAVMIIALATAVAGTDDPSAVQAEINGVTQEGGTECEDFASCKELIDGGEDITYNGVLGVLNFQEAGEPGAGSYDIWEVQDDGSISTVETVEISL
jgi:ABC-type branched-subunit amino acid transport system substrate-binding protein